MGLLCTHVYKFGVDIGFHFSWMPWNHWVVWYLQGSLYEERTVVSSCYDLRTASFQLTYHCPLHCPQPRPGPLPCARPWVSPGMSVGGAAQAGFSYTRHPPDHGSLRSEVRGQTLTPFGIPRPWCQPQVTSAQRALSWALWGTPEVSINPEIEEQTP